MAAFPDRSFMATSLFLCVFLVLTTTQGQITKHKENYCPYFGNRAPSTQPELQNCTWYKDNACCLPKELNTILDAIPPLTGANKKCMQSFNYLMCYVCAPNQNIFYKNERLTVCSEFCDKLFEECGQALLKGSKISSAYKSGQEFCESRKFLVKAKASEECFAFDPVVDSSGKTLQFEFHKMLVIFMLGSLWSRMAVH